MTSFIALCILVHLPTAIPLRANDPCDPKSTCFAIGIPSISGLVGGLVGFVGSAFAASSATPQKSFPTRQEYFASLAIYQGHLAEYSTYAVPICAGVACIGTVIWRQYYLYKKSTETDATEAPIEAPIESDKLV
jgi:hypothetical protein